MNCTKDARCGQYFNRESYIKLETLMLTLDPMDTTILDLDYYL